MEVTAATLHTLADSLIKTMESTHQRVPVELEALRNEAEYEMRCGLSDPSQMDLRDVLDLRGRHERTLAGRGV